MWSAATDGRCLYGGYAARPLENDAERLQFTPAHVTLGATVPVE